MSNHADHDEHSGNAEPEAQDSDVIDEQVDPEEPHYKIDERERAEHDLRSLPPNPHADTAYGPVRGSDPANPETSAT
ncbi:MAG: hypothetical protein JWN62_4717 [Acidimicrobiales bacterium]|jgi:hypothetical protein|nr:hypothetical protein [Acidimicrobiales bacterium]